MACRLWRCRRKAAARLLRRRTPRLRLRTPRHRPSHQRRPRAHSRSAEAGSRAGSMDWPSQPGDERVFRRSGPFSPAAVAGAEAPLRRLMLSGVAPLQSAEGGEVSFLDNRKYAAALAETRAGAVIV